MNIQTSHDRPPIPTRDCDWSAIDQDSYDGAEDAHPSRQIIGRGPTEIAAINNLVEQLVEQADARADKKPRDVYGERVETPLAIGQLWRRQVGPWDSEKPPVRILDMLDGWVRYYVNEYMPDERLEADIFRCCYQVLVESVDEDVALGFAGCKVRA